MLKVGVNGYGTIGRRVAHAISIQDDMKVVGIVKTRPDYISKIASREFSLYVPDESALKYRPFSVFTVKWQVFFSLSLRSAVNYCLCFVHEVCQCSGNIDARAQR